MNGMQISKQSTKHTSIDGNDDAVIHWNQIASNIILFLCIINSNLHKNFFYKNIVILWAEYIVNKQIQGKITTSQNGNWKNNHAIWAVALKIIWLFFFVWYGQIFFSDNIKPIKEII